MKLKKVVSICLVGALAATLLAGCGSSDETVGEEIKDDAEEVVEDVKDVAEDVGEGVEDAVEDVGEDVKDAAEEAVDDVKENAEGENEETETASYSFGGFDQMISIDMLSMTEYTTAGQEEVTAAINEISEAVINVHVNIESLELASFTEHVGLMLAGGEPFDLLCFWPADTARYAVMQSKNQLMDISDYVWDYAPEMMELVEPYIEALMVGDAIYGIPDYRIYNSDYYLIMRKDILDELGLTEKAQNLSNWEEVEEIFQAVYDAQDTLPEELQTTCIICGNVDGSVITHEAMDLAADNFSDFYTYDELGDSYRIINVQDGVVTNNFASEDYLTCCNRVRSWYENGWVYKDAQAQNESAGQLMTNQVTFAYFDLSEFGVEAQKKKQTGYDCICVEVCPGMIQTANVSRWGWAVPVTSTEPEAAVAFMNLMFTNADIVNYFVYGIEGRDYEINENGEAVVLEDAVYQSCDWYFGNQYLAYPAEDQGGDFREQALDHMLNTEVSPYFGAYADADPIEQELSAVYAVIQQYAPGLESGTQDAADTYDDFLAALDAAGMQTILDYYQDALDEFLAEQ